MINTWTSKEIENILIQLDQQDLPFKQYAFTEMGQGLNLLGYGGFALVYEGESRKKNEKKFAIKVIGFGDKHVDSQFFRNSVNVQKELGEYENDVVKVFDYIEVLAWIDDNNQVTKAEKVEETSMERQEGNVLRLQFIVMEKIDTVISHDKSGKPHLTPNKLAEFDEKEILKLAYDIGHAILRAHEKKVLHRDIKLENIFYSSKEKHYKFGDFGIAKATDDGMASTVTFTKGYGAPEVVGSLDEKYDNTADIYSFGMMLYVLSNGLKFPDSDNYNVNLSAQYRRGYILPIPEKGTDELYCILDKMCRFDPDERYQSMQAVMSDLDRLIYNPVIQYKKKHNTATAVVGIIFWLLGAATWMVTIQPDEGMNFSRMLYLLLALGIAKAMLHIFKKKIWFANLLIFGVGIYYMISTGFRWTRLLLYLCILISSGNFAGVLSGTLLTTNIIELLETNGVLVVQRFDEYMWIPITLLSLALALFYQYIVLLDKNQKFTMILFTKNRFWILISVLYAEMIINGWNFNKGNTWLYDKLLGYDIVNLLCKIDLIKVGTAGLIFCLFWTAREMILVKRQRKMND